MVMFLVVKMPEVAETEVSQRRGSVADDATVELAVGADGQVIGSGPLYKQYNMIFGFMTQFCYVGAQVACGALFINYATEAATYSAEQASQMLSYALITFTVGRFIATAIATVLEPNFMLMCYAACAVALTSYVAAGEGVAGVVVLILVFFFMAPMYPTIFTLGTANLGRHTRRGAGILVMGVSGGAVFPPMQAAVADGHGTKISFVVPACGFIAVLAYGAFHWYSHGFHILRVKGEQVLATSLEGGAVGGVVTTTHYDEKRLSVAAVENVRRASIGDVTVKGVTGGINHGGKAEDYRRGSIL